MKVNDTYNVNIFKQDYFGRGITKIDNRIVFVNDVLPDEVCMIEIVNVKKKYAEGRLKTISDFSLDRVDAICPYYGICGGCQIMHQKYQKQLEFKNGKVKELLEKITGLKHISIADISYQEQFFYRNKIILHASDNKLGYYQEKTNQVIEIKKCFIASQKINDVISLVYNFLANTKSNLTSIMIRTNSLNEVMLVVEGTALETDLLKYLDTIDIIYLNSKLVKGRPYLIEELFGMKFQIYPNSFFQVNYEMVLKMYQLVIDFYKDKNYNQVLDLYCGTGTIGMLVSPYIKKVFGVEVEHSSIESANVCKKINMVDNIEFIEGKVEDYIDSFQNIDSIIVDPPRSGLDSYSVDTILKLSPETIIYISCDPATLARDLKMLIINYEILKIYPIDMFPNTYHVECVCVLNRR